MKKKVTLQDIANRLGVSRGLVSLALADSELVNQNTRSEIIVTALEMGYNINKRKIGSTRKDIFSLVCTDSSYLNTFFWAEVIKGMENTLAKRGIGLDLVMYNPNTDDEKFLIDIVNRKTKGLIIVASCNRKIYAALAKSGLPIVVVDGDNYYGMECDSVEVTNYYSAYTAARFFVAKGHTHLAFVGSTGLAMSFKQRRNGFRDGSTFLDKSIEYSEVSDLSASAFSPRNSNWYTFNSAKLKRLLQKKNRPTAIMCANDYTASGVYKIMQKMGLRCPEDISLIGFDNIEYDDPFIKRLTTFCIDKKELGETAVNILVNRIKNPNMPKQVIQNCAPMLERESVLTLSPPKISFMK